VDAKKVLYSSGIFGKKKTDREERMKKINLALVVLLVAITTMVTVGCKNTPKAKPPVHQCDPIPDFTEYERDDLRFEVMQTVDMFTIAVNRQDIEELKCLIEKIKKLIDALGPEDKSAKRNLIKLEALGYGIIDLVENEEIP
jgi:hypothetical protein